MHSPATLIFIAKDDGPNGYERHTAITLPFVSILATDLRRTTAAARTQGAAVRAPAAMVGEAHPQNARQGPRACGALLNRSGYERVVWRIMREGPEALVLLPVGAEPPAPAGTCRRVTLAARPSWSSPAQ
jgi:hypothetical protein